MTIEANDQISLHYEVLGDKNQPAVFMLAGAGRPSTDYDALFYEPLISAGYCPIRVDQRDTGKSMGFSDTPLDLHGVKAAALGQGAVQPPYGIADMAQDIFHVMDRLSIPSAHFVGRSIGGLVAQYLAIADARRVKSLALIMAMSRSLADVVSDTVLERLMAEHVPDEDAYAARQLLVAKANSLAQDFDAERAEKEARLAWRHGFHAGGTARHFAACLAAPDLRPALADLEIAALIIHGQQDQTIPVQYAQETAAAIAGSQFLVDHSMGHDGSPRLRRRWAAIYVDFLRQAHKPK